MTRVVPSVENVQAVKSNEIPLPPERSVASDNRDDLLDLHLGVKGQSKQPIDLPIVGCPETNGLVFPIDCLPGPMRAITEGTSRQERNPHGLAAACVLGAVSAAIGKGLVIESHVNKTCPANLYLLVGTPSGQGKSETIRAIVKPLRAVEDQRILNWTENTRPDLEARERRFKSVIKGLERQLMSPKFRGDPQSIQTQLADASRQLAEASKRLLAPPCLVAENATSEAAARLLSLNDEFLAFISPDARELIDILCGKYTEGKTDESIFVKGYSWDPYASHRITRDPISLKSPCLVCLWLVQPDKIAEIVSYRSLTEGGLLPRFLLLVADYDPQPIDRNVQGLCRETEVEWDKLIRELLNAYRFAAEPFVLSPTKEARDLLDNHFNAIVAKRKSTLREIKSFAARWNEQAWRLAVVLHAGRYGGKAHDHKVDQETVRDAITLADWFSEHQLWVLRRSELSAFIKLTQRILELCRSQSGGITASDLYRKHLVANAEAAHAVLEKMHESGLLDRVERPTPGGGHVSRIYAMKVATSNE